MLSFPPTVRVFVCGRCVDLRNSFDGLAGCVERILSADPLSGHLFVFFNRRGNLVKILVWDRTGYCVYSKRLESGRFSYARTGAEGETHVVVDYARLLLILEGIDLCGARQRRRFHLS